VAFRALDRHCAPKPPARENHLGHTKCGGTMKVIAFITEYAVVDRIIDHLKLRFVADKPPPSHVFEQVALAVFAAIDMAARPTVVFHHDHEGIFIAWSGVSRAGRVM